MKALRLGPGAALLAIAALLLTVSTPAFADSFQIFHVLSGTEFTSPFSIAGMTASGAVIVESHPGNGCPAPFPCFTTFVHGEQVGRGTPVDPGHYDNGMPCAPRVSPVPAGSGAFGTCNSGYEIDEIDSPLGDRIPMPYAEIFTGPDPVADFFSVGSVLFLNSSGDFVYQVGGPKVGDPFDDYEAIDLTTSETPEPSSIFLLGTGLLAGLGTLRRRFF